MTEIEKLIVEASVMSEMMRQGRLIATGKDARMVDRLIAALRAMQAGRDEWRRQAMWHNSEHGQRVTELRAAEAKLAAVEKERDAAREDRSDAEARMETAEATVATLTAQVEAMRGALTPSADTKADYIGEFSFPYCTGFDDYGHDIITQISVPWSTIKEIMAAIRARAALTTENQTNG